MFSIKSRSWDRPSDEVIQLLVNAYAHLRRLPQHRGRFRTAPIASFGMYEVRLGEVSGKKEVSRFWLELYDRVGQQVVDGEEFNGLHECSVDLDLLLETAKVLSELERQLGAGNTLSS